MKTLKILLSLLVFVSFNLSLAQEYETEVLSNNYFQQSNEFKGNDYWFSVPTSYGQSKWDTIPNAIHKTPIRIIVISSNFDEVRLEIPLWNIDTTQTIKPNQETRFDLEANKVFPFNLYDRPYNLNIPANIYPKAGIHITSKLPISVYVLVNYSYAAEAWLATPTEYLGKEYIVSAYRDSYFDGRMPSICNITGIYDSTKISLLVGGLDSNAKISSALDNKLYKYGDVINFELNKGDVFTFMDSGQYVYQNNRPFAQSDISGSKIKSNKPISVVAGNFCGNVPYNNGSCNYLAEALPPTETWGNTVFVPVLPTRKKSGIIRIYSKENDASIYRDGIFIGKINNSGGINGDGWIETRVVPDNEKPRPAVYSSDKPILVNFFNTGVQEEPDTLTKTDPFSIILCSPEQFQNEVLITQQLNKPYNYDFKNYLSLVFENDKNDSIPDDLLLGEIIKGKFVWKKIKEISSENDYLFKGRYKGKLYSFKNIQLSNYGVYKIKCSSNKFIAYSFGYRNYDGYGFRTSPASNFINKIEPSLECMSIDMQNTNINKAKDSIVIGFLTNNSNFAINVDSIYFEGVDSYAFKLKGVKFPLTVTKFSNYSSQVEFKPLKSGVHKAELIIITRFDTIRCEISGIGTNLNSDCEGAKFSISKFDNKTPVNLYGKAIISNDSTIRLTQTKVNEIGAISYNQPVPLSNSFYMGFSFRFSNGNNYQFVDGSLEGADGIAILFQNTEGFNISSKGGSLAYNGLLNSVALEIDMYKNIYEFNDPNGNHIALQVPFKDTLKADHNEFNTFNINDSLFIIKPDSTIYYGFIEYNYEIKQLDFYLDTTKNSKNLVLSSKNFNLPEQLNLTKNDLGFIGITSSTGASAETHEILSWEFCADKQNILSIKNDYNLDSSNDENFKLIKIFDINSCEIYSEQIDNGLFNFKNINLANGLYIMIIIDKDNIIKYRKFIVNN